MVGDALRIACGRGFCHGPIIDLRITQTQHELAVLQAVLDSYKSKHGTRAYRPMGAERVVLDVHRISHVPPVFITFNPIQVRTGSPLRADGAIFAMSDAKLASKPAVLATRIALPAINRARQKTNTGAQESRIAIQGPNSPSTTHVLLTRRGVARSNGHGSCNRAPEPWAMARKLPLRSTVRRHRRPPR
jgi:hypothetical protein